MKTNKSKTKPALGRGLSSLLGENKTNLDNLITNNDLNNNFNTVGIEFVSPGPWQARKIFDKNELINLAKSIKDHGIIQPIVVTKDDYNKEKFLIIAGERRWRAAQLAKLHEIPVIIQNNLEEKKIIEISLLENLQRTDLNAIEEAKGYKNLIEDYNYKQETVAKVVGKSRPYITNLMRLLTLPEYIQSLIITDKLSTGHVRPLIGRTDALSLAKEIVRRKFSVRQVETYIKSLEYKKSSTEKLNHHEEIENKLTEKIGLKIKIQFNPKNEKGSITISCENLEQFDDLIKKIKNL